MELLIGIAVAAIFVVGAATIVVPSLKVSTQAGNVQEQAQLAQELLSNVRAWSMGNWGSVLALATGTTNGYYLNTATSPFTAVGTSTTGEAISTCSGGSGGASSYSYSRAITISHLNVSSTDQASFPMLFSLASSTYLATTGHGGNVTNANGYDIIFTSDAAGKNILPFEQESYSSSTGAANYWVQIPKLSHSVDTTIYIQYGNSNITTSQANPTAVWDTNYMGVWHLPNGTTLSANDSTVNGNNGVVTGATATTGEIDGALNNPASNSGYINLSSTGLATAVPSTFTLEAWVNMSGYGNWPAIVSFDSNNSNDWGLYDESAYGIGLVVANNMKWMIGSGSFSAGWNQVVATWDGTTATMYLNGVVAGSSHPDSGYTNSILASIGLGYGGEYFNGSIDEVRVSSNNRSAGWIATEYANESSPGTFYSVGSATNPSSGTVAGSVCTTYNRYFYLSDVYRDSNGNVTSTASGNYYDPSTKLVTVAVSAASSTAPPLTYSLYITRSGNNALSQTTWIGGSGQNGVVTFVSSTYSTATSVTVNATGSLSLSQGPAPGGACYVTTESSLVAYWAMNEGSGTTTSDSSGNGNTGTLSSPAPTWVTGHAGNALSFSGSSNYVTANAINPASGITVSAWVYSTNFNQNGMVVEEDPKDTEWELFFSNNLLRWSGGDTTVVTSTIPSNSNWHFIAATQTGTSAVLYVDGTAVASGTITAIGNSGLGTSIGRYYYNAGQYGGYYFTGTIDEVKVYDRPLSATEIGTLYSGGTVN
jgi:type II secretory pathway pseudopilin PulG